MSRRTVYWFPPTLDLAGNLRTTLVAFDRYPAPTRYALVRGLVGGATVTLSDLGKAELHELLDAIHSELKR